MELHQLSSLDPDALKQLLKEDYFDLNGIYIIEVYNALMHGVLETPAQIARLAEVAVEVYTAQGREEETILYLELAGLNPGRYWPSLATSRNLPVTG